MIDVPFYITAGLPFEKTIIVTLPTGRSWWTLSAQFEVLAQMREEPNKNTLLLLDLTPYLTMIYTAPDILTINFIMTGFQTKNLNKSGYYDIIISDVGTVDARAIQVLKGPLLIQFVTTGATVGLA